MASFNFTTLSPVHGQLQSQHHISHPSERIQPDDYDSGYESESDLVMRPPISNLPQSQQHISHPSECIQPDDYDSGYESDEDTVRPSSMHPPSSHEDIDGHVNPALSLRQRPLHDIQPSAHTEPFSPPGKIPEHDSPTPKADRGKESFSHDYEHPPHIPTTLPPQGHASSPSSSSSSSPSSPADSPQPSPSPSPTQSQLLAPSMSPGRRDAATQTPAHWSTEGEMVVARDGRLGDGRAGREWAD